MIRAIVEEEDGISLFAYIDVPTNLVKYYEVYIDYLVQKFYAYSKAKLCYDSLHERKSIGDDFKW